MDLSQTGGEFRNDKLAHIANGLKGYQHSLDISKRERQEKDEEYIHRIKMDIARLNEVLKQEVQRRTETNKAISGMFEAHMTTVQDKLEATVTHRLDTLYASVEALNQRVEFVEKDFAATLKSYHEDLKDKGELVAQDITGLKASFQAENEERREREILMIAKVKDVERRTAEALAKERDDLEAQVPKLHEELNGVGHEEDQRFHDYVFQELAALKTGLVQESQTREQADDEIVAALNHYTKSVQEAMRVVNQA